MELFRERITKHQRLDMSIGGALQIGALQIGFLACSVCKCKPLDTTKCILNLTVSISIKAGPADFGPLQVTLSSTPISKLCNPGSKNGFGAEVSYTERWSILKRLQTT